MYKGKKILGLITARGGSRGIPGKNIKLLGPKPLIHWTIQAAKASRYLDDLIVSTDSQEIADIAKALGSSVPFLRPAELSRDESRSVDVILHALDHLNSEYDYVLLLQPTSPFRTSNHINEIIEHGIDNNHEIIVSATETKKHPNFMFTLNESLQFVPFVQGAIEKPRQALPKVYSMNGALYLFTPQAIRKFKSFITSETKAYLMDELHSMDLDTLDDWELAECLLGRVLSKKQS